MTTPTEQISITQNIFNQYPKIFVNRLDKENHGNFTQVFNHIIDAKISESLNLPPLRPTASLLLQNIIAKKDGWSFSITDMAKRVNVGKDAITTARKELIEKGYLQIIRYIDKLTGRVLGSKYFASECAEFLNDNKSLIEKKTIYHIKRVNAETFIKSDSLPCTENPTMDKPEMAKPSMEKQYTINTYSTNTKLINNSSINSEKENLEQQLKTSIETLTPAKNNDAAFLNKFEEEEEAKPSLNIFQDIKDKSSDKDDLTHTQEISGGAVAIPPAGDELIKELFGNGYVDKEIKELVYLFKNATWFNPKSESEENIEFDLTIAKKLITESKNYDVIRNALKHLPARDFSTRENPNPAGYVIAEIKAGGYAAPKGFYDNVSKEKEKKEADLYTRIGQIWGYTGRIGNVICAFTEVSRLCKRLLDSNKLDEIKEKIQETAKYIAPIEVIKKDYLIQAGAI